MTNRLSRGEAAVFLGLLFCGCLAFFLLGVYAGMRSVAEPRTAVETAQTTKSAAAVPQDLGFYRDMLSGPDKGGQGAADSSSVEPPVATKPEPDPADPPVSAEPAPEAAPHTFWTVQVGALDSADEARQVIIRLEARGYSARLVEPRAGVKDFYRVWVGEFEDSAAAHAFEERLKADGFHTYSKRVEEPDRSN